MTPKAPGCLRVVSLNVNGLRSSCSKGVLDWFEQSGADVLCLQETRLQSHQWLDSHKPAGWHTHLFPAERAGYAGTAIYSRIPFLSIRDGLDFELCDTEGRFTLAEFARPDGSTFGIASVYFPSGSSSEQAQLRKDAFMERIEPLMIGWRQQERSLIVCGDVNIAHRAIDLKNWKANQKFSGFLPHERDWMDRVYGEMGFVDAFRHLHPDLEAYSWWSNRGQAFAKNVGWRIDYQIATPDWRDTIVQASIYKDQRFSDHAPVIVDYQLA